MFIHLVDYFKSYLVDKVRKCRAQKTWEGIPDHFETTSLCINSEMWCTMSVNFLGIKGTHVYEFMGPVCHSTSYMK